MKEYTLEILIAPDNPIRKVQAESYLFENDRINFYNEKNKAFRTHKLVASYPASSTVIKGVKDIDYAV